MPDETVVRNSIKIFSSKYMADLSSDLSSSYVLGLNIMTTYKNNFKQVFDKEEPVLLEEPMEDVQGVMTIAAKGLKSILACLSREDETSFSAVRKNSLNDFHLVANCYDPKSNDNYVAYYLEFCRIKGSVSTDMSDIGKHMEIRFSSGATRTALGAFDAFNVIGTDSANQEIPFNFTPVPFENSYATRVFKDDAILVKDTDYSEDLSKVTIFDPVAVTSKITVVYIYNP